MDYSIVTGTGLFPHPSFEHKSREEGKRYMLVLFLYFAL